MASQTNIIFMQQQKRKKIYFKNVDSTPNLASPIYLLPQ